MFEQVLARACRAAFKGLNGCVNRWGFAQAVELVAKVGRVVSTGYGHSLIRPPQN